MENWGFLLVGAKNAFNEINRVGMLWTVFHLWPSGARFVFNCYCQWSSIVLRNRNGTAVILHSRKCVSQGEPLAMVNYGIGVLLLIQNPKTTHPEFTKPWYANYVGALDTFVNIKLYFNLLKIPAWAVGINLNPSKMF